MDVDDYTTTLHNTPNNITFLLQLEYLWHPYYGKLFEIHQQFNKGGISIYRCSLANKPKYKNTEIPTWMFDKILCSKMKLLEHPYCSLESLEQLCCLLYETCIDECIISQDQNTFTEEGDGNDIFQATGKDNRHATIRTSISSPKNMEQTHKDRSGANRRANCQNDDSVSNGKK